MLKVSLMLPSASLCWTDHQELADNLASITVGFGLKLGVTFTNVKNQWNFCIYHFCHYFF